MNPRRTFATRILRTVARIAFDRRGGTAIEYGLIAALVVVSMIVALTTLANTTTGMWNNVSTAVTSH